jgi:hypothetical protein
VTASADVLASGVLIGLFVTGGASPGASEVGPQKVSCMALWTGDDCDKTSTERPAGEVMGFWLTGGTRPDTSGVEIHVAVLT